MRGHSHGVACHGMPACCGTQLPAAACMPQAAAACMPSGKRARHRSACAHCCRLPHLQGESDVGHYAAANGTCVECETRGCMACTNVNATSTKSVCTRCNTEL